MSWQELTASLVESLAWPAGLVVFAFLFRGQLRDLLTAVGPMRRLKVGIAEVEYDQAVKEVEAATADAVEQSRPEPPPQPTGKPLEPRVPSAIYRHSMIGDYMQLLRSVELLVMESGERTLPATTPDLVGIALKKTLISQASARAIEGMSHLIGLAEHRAVTKEEADEFRTNVAALMYAIRQDADRRHATGSDQEPKQSD